jgi:hypothetical protein
VCSCRVRRFRATRSRQLRKDRFANVLTFDDAALSARLAHSATLAVTRASSLRCSKSITLFADAAQRAHGGVCQSEPRVPCTTKRQVECQRSSTSERKVRPSDIRCRWLESRGAIGDSAWRVGNIKGIGCAHPSRMELSRRARDRSRCSSECQRNGVNVMPIRTTWLAVVALAACSAAGTRETLGTHDSGAPRAGTSREALLGPQGAVTLLQSAIAFGAVLHAWARPASPTCPDLVTNEPTLNNLAGIVLAMPPQNPGGGPIPVTASALEYVLQKIPKVDASDAAAGEQRSRSQWHRDRGQRMPGQRQSRRRAHPVQRPQRVAAQERSHGGARRDCLRGPARQAAGQRASRLSVPGIPANPALSHGTQEQT